VKIRVKQVLLKSAVFYKENFKHLAGLSFAMFMVLMLTEVSTYLSAVLEKNPEWADLFELAELSAIIIFAILIIAILPKLYLIMIILINSLLSKSKMTLGEAYRQTKGKYWLTVRCFFIVWLPLILIGIFSTRLALICEIFIIPYFYVLFPLIAIEPRKKYYLRRSFKMIEGNYPAALLLNLLTSTLWMAIYDALTSFYQGKSTGLLILGVGYAFLCFFILPIAITTTVIVYRQLKGN
jgi:hypothetical protein